MKKSPYDTLKVDENASDKDIKKAFRDKSKIHHPDKGGDEDKFKETVHAYSILKDPNKRKRYDETGDTDTDDPLADIMGDLSQMFFSVVKENNNKIEYLDIIKEMLKILSNAISLAKQAKTDKDKDITQTKTLLNRITKKDDSDNFFEQIIKGRIKQFKHDKTMIQDSIDRFNKMIDIIDMYECSSKEEEEYITFKNDGPSWFRNE